MPGFRHWSNTVMVMVMMMMMMMMMMPGPVLQHLRQLFCMLRYFLQLSFFLGPMALRLRHPSCVHFLIYRDFCLQAHMSSSQASRLGLFLVIEFWLPAGFQIFDSVSKGGAGFSRQICSFVSFVYSFASRCANRGESCHCFRSAWSLYFFAGEGCETRC